MEEETQTSPETLGEMLRREQVRRGFTDVQCADEMGVNQQTYSTWKRDKSLPRPPSHQVVARFLRMKVNKLRAVMAESQAPVVTAHEIRLEADGDSILITRRGGGSLLVTQDADGFHIATAPRQK